jgi:hypothetical protein
MLFKELSIILSHAPTLWCDNVSALALASNPVYHAHTKHIEVDYHFIRAKVVNGDILVNFISTLDQSAGIFTKGLSSTHFSALKSKLMATTFPIRLRGDVSVHTSKPIKASPNHATEHYSSSTTNVSSTDHGSNKAISINPSKIAILMKERKEAQ